MMLWVNLIMDTLGALSLVRRIGCRLARSSSHLPHCRSPLRLLQGTQPPSDKLLQRKPYSSMTSLIQLRMWRHILVQVGRRGGVEKARLAVPLTTVAPRHHRSPAQAAFQFTVLMAFLIGGSVWLGVSEEFLNTNGVEGMALSDLADFSLNLPLPALPSLSLQATSLQAPGLPSMTT